MFECPALHEVNGGYNGLFVNHAATVGSIHVATLSSCKKHRSSAQISPACPAR